MEGPVPSVDLGACINVGLCALFGDEMVRVAGRVDGD